MNDIYWGNLPYLALNEPTIFGICKNFIGLFIEVE